EAVHKETLATADAAPQVGAAHGLLAREQTDQRSLEPLQRDQVFVDALQDFERRALRCVELEAMRLPVLAHPRDDIGTVFGQREVPIAGAGPGARVVVQGNFERRVRNSTCVYRPRALLPSSLPTTTDARGRSARCLRTRPRTPSPPPPRRSVRTPSAR